MGVIITTECFSVSFSGSESVANSFVVSILMDIFACRRAAADETPTVFDFALWLNDFRDMFSQVLVLWTPSAAPRIILRALRVASREFEYRRPMQKKKAMYKNVWPATTMEIREAMAQRLVRKPVFTEKRMSLLIIVSDLWNPVRERCKIVHRVPAMSTSPAAANALTMIDKLFRWASWAKVSNRNANTV